MSLNWKQKKWGTLVIMLGDFSIFIFETVRSTRFLWRRRRLFLSHCELIGVNSLWINFVAALFLGAVLGYQLYFSLHRFGAEALLGGTVGVALFRELAPVMSAIMVTGRAGAAMAAELSSMRISDQIDALEVMSVNPIEYLVLPRVLAGFLMMPILALCFTVIASWSACVISCGVLDLQYSVYWSQYLKVVDFIEIIHCLVKSAFFGLILTLVGCFCGFRAYGGASSVGSSTRTAVVLTCLLILMIDYFITSLLPHGYKKLEVSL